MEMVKRAIILGLFVGNLSPLFLIVTVIYFGIPRLFYPLLSLTIFSFLLNILWLKVLSHANAKKTPYNTKPLNIKEADDLGSLVISYFLMYTLSLPSVAAIGGVKGLIVLGIVLCVTYIVLQKNSIMLYNPFLSIGNYRLYKVITTTKAVGYLIVKKEPGIDHPIEGRIDAVQFDDFIYIKRKLHTKLEELQTN